MKKLFNSKVAFIVFAILFTAFLFTTYKDPFARFMWGLSMGGFIGFVCAQWYWIEKMKKIQHLIDARMSNPEQTELLKRKDEELFEAANNNTKLLDRIGELQNVIKALEDEIVLLKESNKDLLAEREYIQRSSKEMRERLNVQESKEKGE